MNTNWIYALIAIIVLGVGAAYLLTRSGTSAQNDTGADTRELKTYYDERYKMAFNFPDSYDVSSREVSAGHHAIVLVDKIASSSMPQASDGSPSITIDIFDKPSSLVPATWVKNTKDSNYVAESPLSETKVADAPAVAYVWDGLYPSTSIAFAHSSRMYVLSVSFNSPSDQIYRDFAGVVASVQLDP